ncbi:transcription initiation factor TFIID subunit 4-like isoform X2 [Varroa destructor]|uniref:TAFH domain-containing protein n=1 Tax=Varroa destructor TaxID=109461 RepID=A0A7M7J480_VARDE|nr:transcription initiation factor TFIID subunit 4-like isoform X2 [Varroa destructor]
MKSSSNLEMAWYHRSSLFSPLRPYNPDSPRITTGDEHHPRHSDYYNDDYSYIQVQVQPDGEPKQPAGLQLVNVQRNLKPAPPRVILSPQIRMATSAPQMLRAGHHPSQQSMRSAGPHSSGPHPLGSSMARAAATATEAAAAAGLNHIRSIPTHPGGGPHYRLVSSAPPFQPPMNSAPQEMYYTHPVSSHGTVSSHHHAHVHHNHHNNSISTSTDASSGNNSSGSNSNGSHGHQPLHISGGGSSHGAGHHPVGHPSQTQIHAGYHSGPHGGGHHSSTGDASGHSGQPSYSNPSFYHRYPTAASYHHPTGLSTVMPPPSSPVITSQHQQQLGGTSAASVVGATGASGHAAVSTYGRAIVSSSGRSTGAYSIQPLTPWGRLSASSPFVHLAHRVPVSSMGPATWGRSAGPGGGGSGGVMPMGPGGPPGRAIRIATGAMSPHSVASIHPHSTIVHPHPTHTSRRGGGEAMMLRAITSVNGYSQQQPHYHQATNHSAATVLPATSSGSHEVAVQSGAGGPSIIGGAVVPGVSSSSSASSTPPPSSASSLVAANGVTGGASSAGGVGVPPGHRKEDVVLHQPQGQVTMQAGATMAAPAVRPLTVQTAHQPPATTAGGGQQQQQNTASQMSPNTAKKKCKNFLATLIRLASDQPVQTATNVKALIQGLIDGNIPPEDFTTQLQRELNSSPQPCLVPFLKKSLPHLRQSLMTKELSIEGVRPPPPGSLGPTTTTTTVAAPVSQPSQPPQAIIRAASAGPTTTTTVRLLQPQRLVTVTPPPRAILSQAGHPISATGAMTKSIVVQAPTPTKPSPAPKVPKPPAAPKTPATPKTPAASRNAAQAAAAAAQAAAAAATAAASVAPATPASTTAVATVATTTVAAAASTQAAVAGAGATIPGATTTTGAAEKVRYGSALREDDDINDVAAMGGVNLQEESQRILASSELVGATRSCGDDVFLFSVALEKKITQIAVKHGVDTVDPEVIKLVSHAVQEKLKGYLERLNIASEHRAEPPAFKADAARFEQTTDPRAQLRFVEELDKLERKRHEEHEREMLLRVAKSRSKMEDPEQLKLKQRAKEMQKAEMEEMRQREANMTALQAIGPRKKARLDGTLGGVGSGAGNKAALRPRIKRVNMKDVLFLLETDKNWMRSNFIYKSYLK